MEQHDFFFLFSIKIILSKILKWEIKRLSSDWSMIISVYFRYSLWSNVSFWTSSAVNNFTAPAEGADVVIPAGKIEEKKKIVCVSTSADSFSCCFFLFLLCFRQPTGMWVVLDDSPPPLNKLTVIGVLEIPDSNVSSTRTARSVSAYKSVVIEATYISIQASDEELSSKTSKTDDKAG